MKRCTKCGVEKEIEEFAAQKGCAGGHRPDCKECGKARLKAYRGGLRLRVVIETEPGTRHCHKCSQTKPLAEFASATGRRDGVASRCRSCYRDYYLKNRDHVLAGRKAHWDENSTRILAERKANYEANRDSILARNRAAYAAMTPEQRERWRKRAKNYTVGRSAETVARTRAWRLANPGARAEQERKRKAEDPLYKFRCSIRAAISSRVKSGYGIEGRSAEILGCSYDEFRAHIEKQFKKGMTWANHGEWQVDHRIPLSSATSKREVLYLSHYMNLQPLWAKDNNKKSDTMPDRVQLHLMV